MSNLLYTADLHLGHRGVIKWRTQFATVEEHDEYVLDRLASNVGKKDSVIFGGDVAFDPKYLERIEAIRCQKKILILGNHDTQYCPLGQLMMTFDVIHSMLSKRNNWITHCPIHPQEFRSRQLNIHGHLHDGQVTSIDGTPDARYFNVCLENTDYKPISHAEIMERI